MNERLNNNKIYILAKEAGLIEFEKLTWNPELQSPTYESVAKARKFAELIVRECAGVAFDEYAATNGAASGESAILKHFGVEE